MLNSAHPDDERLSALAAGDTDASDDATLSTHVTACDRCASVVRELGVLRATLADLPDIAPHRPLRLLPPVDADAPGAADRLGQWARRLFAPALTAGAALAMVGVVGTALPTLSGMLASGQAGAAPGDASAPSEAARLHVTAGDSAAPAAAASAAQEFAPLASEGGAGGTGAEGDVTTQDTDLTDEAGGEVTRDAGGSDTLLADRSPWPMVLFAGIALMIGAALLRWILVPRAG